MMDIDGPDGGPPNVLLLVTDDQGAWALPSLMPELRTPTLDRLQREGRTFEQYFCASPVCSPARASMATGRMPSAHGIHDWLHPEALARTDAPRRPFDPDFLEDLPGADTLGAMFSRHGYRCGMTGKWHLGSADRPAEGFEYWYAHQLGGGPYYDAPIWQQADGTGVPASPAQPGTEPSYLTDAITDRALEFLRGTAADRRPFFLQVTWTAPHDPWFDGNHPADLLDLYADTDFPSVPKSPPHPWFVRENFSRAVADRHGALAGYCAALSGVDRSIEAILAQLERTEMLENTIVVFTSDNGFSCGHHGIWGKGNATAPLNLWEPSITVPLIVRWPGHVPAGTRDRTPTSATGLLETLAELTGAVPREDPLRAGRSFAARLVGGRDAPDGTRAGEECGVDPADEPIVIHDEYGAHRMIRTDGWKLVLRREGPTELFHLQEDPGEEHDLSRDPVHAARRRALGDELTSWFAAHETAALSGWDAAVDGAGQRRPLG
ncbi:sulfatase-like hydrolase/transferase [Brachybacterium fresconis]|uniref:Arylsulfatase A-like enzyme n=1 Tax=Brachybacterium fresconis TaxID=173363 RepID=A0ABS4YK37_9MICO|nr:sulfatase-like hydrolase/transferase [Brachybacterium fresconis]MBP2409164.1 arylsulfatase A-like enzyme [Brachybacterium fresconis]